MRRAASPVPTLLAVALAACLTGSDSVTVVRAGVWGGTGVEMTVSATETKTEFDCAHGVIRGTIPVSDGRFDVAGTFVTEGGPTPDDETRNQHPARYRGTAEARAMTLEVEVEGLGKSGPFSLELGRPARLRKCQ